jgi:hypothetical protein
MQGLNHNRKKQSNEDCDRSKYSIASEAKCERAQRELLAWQRRRDMSSGAALHSDTSVLKVTSSGTASSRTHAAVKDVADVQPLCQLRSDEADACVGCGQGGVGPPGCWER